MKLEEDWLWDRKPGVDSGRKKIIYIYIPIQLAFRFLISCRIFLCSLKDIIIIFFITFIQDTYNYVPSHLVIMTSVYVTPCL